MEDKGWLLDCRNDLDCQRMAKEALAFAGRCWQLQSLPKLGTTKGLMEGH
jgi:hypothetical protein